MIRVRYHTDCDYFAGCETMLVNFFADEGLAREVQASFSYRASPEYEKGLAERVRRAPRLIPLKVLDFHQVSGVANGWPSPAREIFKGAMRLLMVRYLLALWNIIVIYRSLGGESIDILHINNGGFPGAVSCPSAAIAGRLRGIKKIVEVVNNMAVPYDTPDRCLDWPLDRLGAACVDVFVTGSGRARRSLVEVLGLSEGGAVNLPNGMAPRELGEKPEDVRRRLGVGERPLIVVGAVLEERKGHRIFVEALSRLKSAGLSPLPLAVFAGDGSIRAELERDIRERGLEKDVLLLGWVRAPFDLFNAADAVVLPSIGDEDFPNVVLEAMSLGKAVAATKVGGVEEQIEDGVSGLLVAPGSVDDLERCLKALCGDAALRARLGDRARARFEQRFTARAAVARYLELYRSLLA